MISSRARFFSKIYLGNLTPAVPQRWETKYTLLYPSWKEIKQRYEDPLQSRHDRFQDSLQKNLQINRWHGAEKYKIPDPAFLDTIDLVPAAKASLQAGVRSHTYWEQLAWRIERDSDTLSGQELIELYSALSSVNFLQEQAIAVIIYELEQGILECSPHCLSKIFLLLAKDKIYCPKLYKTILSTFMELFSHSVKLEKNIIHSIRQELETGQRQVGLQNYILQYSDKLNLINEQNLNDSLITYSNIVSGYFHLLTIPQNSKTKQVYKLNEDLFKILNNKIDNIENYIYDNIFSLKTNSNVLMKYIKITTIMKKDIPDKLQNHFLQISLNQLQPEYLLGVSKEKLRTTELYNIKDILKNRILDTIIQNSQFNCAYFNKILSSIDHNFSKEILNEIYLCLKSKPVKTDLLLSSEEAVEKEINELFFKVL